MNNKSEAIVDIRDGLSVTDRKILSVLIDMLLPNTYFCRSSKVTHEIEERYAIDPYDSYEIIIDLAREEHQLNLVDGHGNFSYFPAAPDYSECRCSEFLRSLVGNGAFSPDVSIPVDMPLPFLLIAGTPGYCSIDSKIPVHDKASVMSAVFSLIRNPEISNEELMQIIKGPVLYVGGTIINTDELPEIYERGHGEIRFAISRKTLNPECSWRSIKDICAEYCNWYGHKLTKPEGPKKGYYEITIQYNAFLTNGTETRYFSLKEILQEFIKQYTNRIKKRNGCAPNTDMLCQLLASEAQTLDEVMASKNDSELNALFSFLASRGKL